MDSVFRAAAIYVILLLIFRISGRRTLSEITTFDFLLILIISEATQQAMIDSDHSITGAVLVITTLVGMDIGLSLAKQRFPSLGRLLDGAPIIVLRDGKILEHRAWKERVSKEEILAEARHLHGLENLEQIKYAVVEENGGISIIPKERRTADG
jgi:uncharacterized membrane protein YcaP (DUF421 family)